MTVNKKERFIATLEKHKKIIYKIVNSYCPNWEDRKDLEQEIIIQLWKSFDNFDDRYKYSTYMYRISLNVAISFYRRQRKWALQSSHYDVESIFSVTAENGTEETESDDKIRLLQAFINNLNELDKALMLLYLEEKTYEEIASILGITKTNVATKISRIKIKLKKQFIKTENHGST
ncbi:MAG: sigma-70 family RNA polymerase sigma factor [Pricia sp.]|nr:sigma-70 family RNA polymerase sigma factor [Pricia sp.]